MRVAAVDCGTNSIRLLIADLRGAPEPGSPEPPLSDVARTSRIVRLGHGVDKTGRIDPEALRRTMDAVRDYALECREHGVERIRFVATSATRDAENRQDFVDGVRNVLGVDPEVVSGAEEAALSFRGALSVLPASARRPVLVVDLGGGSTELVLGDASPEAGWSMDVGSVRLTERHLEADPPTASEIESARRDVEAALVEAAEHVDLSRARTIVGVAGSITTITAHLLRLDAYRSDVIDGSVADLRSVRAAAAEILALPRDRRAALPYLEPGRVDVIGAGALVWMSVLDAVAQARRRAGEPAPDIVTSEHDILDGIALSLGD